MTPDDLAKSGSEHGEQRAFFAYLAVVALYGFNVADDWAAGMGIEAAKASRTNDMRPLPWMRYVFAIPNGGLRDKITAGKLKAEGVKPGVPDIFVPFPRYVGHAPCSIAHGLFIEMKRTKSTGKAKGRLGEAQEPFHQFLADTGYRVAVCYTWREAVAALKSYLGVT